MEKIGKQSLASSNSKQSVVLIFKLLRERIIGSRMEALWFY